MEDIAKNGHISDDKKKEENLKYISFCCFTIILILLELTSLIVSIVYIVLSPWNFVKKIYKSISIISSVIISLQFCLTLFIFYKTKNIQKEISQSLYNLVNILLIVTIILFILIIILNIYLAIYMSIKLHIADYPEYGGRERDEEYIKKHPNEFGEVSSQDFLITALFPSIICIFNFLSMIVSFCYRRKINSIYELNSETHRRSSIFDRRASIGGRRRSSVMRRGSVNRRASVSKNKGGERKSIVVNDGAKGETNENGKKFNEALPEGFYYEKNIENPPGEINNGVNMIQNRRINSVTNLDSVNRFSGDNKINSKRTDSDD